MNGGVAVEQLPAAAERTVSRSNAPSVHRASSAFRQGLLSRACVTWCVMDRRSAAARIARGEALEVACAAGRLPGSRFENGPH